MHSPQASAPTPSFPPPAPEGTDADACHAFADLGLDPALLSAIAQLGFTTPTPIQMQAIPALLAGHDLIGRARTGSGKTAAFGLPLLHHLRDGGDGVQALVLAPTRELALQVTEALRALGRRLPLKVVAIYGGAPMGPQLRALRAGAAIVVGTPGRVLDHLGRGSLTLDHVQVAVLDEADEMLRMGFAEPVEAILKATPDARQTALFSATMPAPIRRIAATHLREPVEIQVEGQGLSTAHIDQRWLPVNARDKLDALWRVLAAEPRQGVLVFVRTRAACAEVAEALIRRGIGADGLHGDLSQAGREHVLARLRARQLDVVVATDVAARGIDVEHISHVINFDLPTDPETYVHRIGRTGRAGRAGRAISFVTRTEASKVRQLSQRLKVELRRDAVPSDHAIAAFGRSKLQARVEQALAEAEGAQARPLKQMVRALVKAHDPSELVATLLRILAEGAPIDLFAEHAPPAPAPPPAPKRAPAKKPLKRASARKPLRRAPPPKRAGDGPPRRQKATDPTKGRPKRAQKGAKGKKLR
ncbi:MAG: DEAD/DEAH box helicase [Polyangiales bacterium]